MAKKEKKEDRILEEIKRHNSVLMEHMDHQVKTVAEQHGSIVKKLEEHDAHFAKINQRFDTIEMTVMESSRQIKELRSGQEELKTEQKELRSGQDEIKQKLDTALTDHEQKIKKIEQRIDA